MNFNDIQKLMDDFKSSEIRELEITNEGFHIRLSKNEVSFPQNQQLISPQIPTPAIAVDKVNESVKKDEVKSDKPVQEGSFIKSPMVGSIYLKPDPTKDPYVIVGKHVKEGDVVCIIEAMKMMTEIKSDISGTISEILVENEELVEFDQPLFKVTED